MQRRIITPRKNWQEIARYYGFYFHHAHGQLYWDESAYYAFSLKEIEEGLEAPALEIYQMCLSLVDEAAGNEEILIKLKIPPNYWNLIAESWRTRQTSLYGRFDFAYDGKAPAKLLEFNADTPTSLYESAFFQWQWVEELFPDKDQFNNIQERLCDGLAVFATASVMHFASVKGTEEDRATVEYIMDCALQAGVTSKFIYMEDIGVNAAGEFVDLENEPIELLFKLYPWEYIWKDAYSPYVLANKKLRLVEPAWKMLLSNKGILPLLWQRHPNHPNLLPAWFDGDTPGCEDYVSKPVFGREGSNIGIHAKGKLISQSSGIYTDAGFINQQFNPLPNFSGNYPVCGVWVVNNVICGLGIREDKEIITGDLSRFTPHLIE